VGGVASLESGELAGLAASLAVLAVLVLAIMVAIVLRTRVSGGRGSGDSFCCAGGGLLGVGRSKGGHEQQQHTNGSLRHVRTR